MSSTVLLVDDERPILNSLKRVLRADGYRLLAAESGDEALQLLDSEPVDVLISDFRMPGMSGVELLDQASQRHPAVVRLMLSGQADLAQVIEAMNAGAISKFMTKPWDNDEVRATVREALALSREREEPAAPFPGLMASGGLVHELSGRMQQGEDVWLVAMEITNVARSLALLRREEVVHLGMALVDRLKSAVDVRSGVAALDRSIIAFLARLETPDRELAALARALGKPLDLRAGGTLLNFRIGAAHADAGGDAAGAEALMRRALVALGSFEADDPRSVLLFNDELTADLDRRVRLEQDLHGAVARSELICMYQPQVRADTFRIAGAEALVRWNHPDYGVVSPLAFIDIAERTGLIHELGRNVLTMALGQLKALAELGHDHVRVSVNVSPRQFVESDLVDEVTRALRAHRIAPELLEVEITESSVMHDVGHARHVLAGLRDLGVRVALDDFGTGHSSLAQLLQMPLDVLKFDRAFVRYLEEDPASVTLFRHVAGLARDLQLEVVAEGVETLAQAEICREHGCQLLQGYYFFKPLPGEQLQAVLGDEQGAHVH